MNYGKGYKMTFRSISFISLMVLVSGCSSSSGIKRAPETYFKEGQNYYARGKYEDAIVQWKKVKESYSSPLLTTIVELKIADAQFSSKNYIEAAAEYENFRKLHPNNEKAPYALYRLGLCHFNQIAKIDTDQTPLKNALGTFETFLKEYPNSEYAGQAREKLELCKTKESQYEIYIGRFYLRTKQYAAAITRLNGSLEKFPSSPANDEALLYLGQAYIKSGDKAKGKEALERLMKEYKSSKLVDEARKLLAKSA
jgi:outer membrane protein assembly factor BamD